MRRSVEIRSGLSAHLFLRVTTGHDATSSDDHDLERA
jgi:hypothetical protein